MKNRKRVDITNEKRGISKVLIIGLLISIFLIVFVSSQFNQSLQEELAGLESELSNSGYSWLINYSINYTEVDASVMGSGQSTGGIKNG